MFQAGFKTRLTFETPSNGNLGVLMTITKNQNGTAYTLIVEGRLDTVTSPELEKEIQSLWQKEKEERQC